MSAELTELEQKIFVILEEAAKEPLSLREIEERLGRNGNGVPDSFEVRDAVWSLIRKQRADLTPRRLVRAVGA
jgi:hypothetical protein